MADDNKKLSLAGLGQTFESESGQDMAKYFAFLTKEMTRVVAACEEKREALQTLDNYLAGKLQDDDEISRLLPRAADSAAARDKLQSDLAELAREFEIIETLVNSIIGEARLRIKGK